MSAKPAPTDWKYEDGFIDAADGSCVAENVAPEDGKLIVRAVNSHEALLRFAQAYRSGLEDRSESDMTEAEMDLLEMADEAIAQAEEVGS